MTPKLVTKGKAMGGPVNAATAELMIGACLGTI
jgi:hypothetical protein